MAGMDDKRLDEIEATIRKGPSNYIRVMGEELLAEVRRLRVLRAAVRRLFDDDLEGTWRVLWGNDTTEAFKTLQDLVKEP